MLFLDALEATFYYVLDITIYTYAAALDAVASTFSACFLEMVKINFGAISGIFCQKLLRVMIQRRQNAEQETQYHFQICK
ncbi:hypothetical protein RND71_000415 [Anisodus tanguticus]|uniref:Uncharacterized protein n=1 Tax=Anisodus tanguticus TaxID=243964 RepID=A0AAE1SVX3_9SOLA|nr:hypothetical protein RND71_000415 [Anisodus tanguticus]